MKQLLLIITLASFFSCTPTETEFTILYQGYETTSFNTRRTEIITSDEAFTKWTSSLIGSKKSFPSINFDEDIVIIIFHGKRSNMRPFQTIESIDFDWDNQTLTKIYYQPFKEKRRLGSPAINAPFQIIQIQPK